ncbi:MAG: DUF3987 domain-containing protein [Planctomycetes bacterium]|nr:DUF3987 domain-containing protein [Planctomycetota bacterium]
MHGSKPPDAPAELRDLEQWVLWRNIDGRKLPVDAVTRGAAKSNDPTTWTDYERACAELLNSNCDGLGFVFAQGGGLFGIDLDGCIHDGELADWADEILQHFPTYAEISPSGRGVKLWCAGQYGGKGRKLTLGEPIDGKAPAIELYGHGRYFTLTGDRFCAAGGPDCCYGVTDCSAGLAWLLATYWPEPEQPATEHQPMPAGDAHDSIPATVPQSVAERARLYLQHVDPAVSGQNGHNTTFRAACALVVGFGLTPEQAYPLLVEWNGRCQPPWNEKELRHKLASADKEAGERGHLLTEQGYRADSAAVEPTVDLSAILAQLLPTAPATVSDEPTPAGEFPADCLRVPGFIGDVMGYTLFNSLYPQPELALAGAIALMGVLTGRKVCDARNTRTNVYLVGVAPSGSGKDDARATNKEVLIRAGSAAMLGPESIGSSAGLISWLKQQPAALFQLDEVGRLLQTMQFAKSSHLFNIGSQLLKLYSSANQIFVGDAYADVKKIQTIVQPHACVYGTSTPGKFWESLNTDNVTEGLVGRFMVFESARGYPDPVDNGRLELPASIVERARWWLEYVPNRNSGNLAGQGELTVPQCVQHTPEAAERLKEHRNAIAARRKSEPIEQAAVWSRANEKAAKLALLFSCSRADRAAPDCIDIADVERAIKLSNWLTREMVNKVFRHVADSENEARIKKVLGKIRDGMSMSELLRRTQFIKSRDLTEILGRLEETGAIACEWRESGGRTTKVIKRLIA